MVLHAHPADDLAGLLDQVWLREGFRDDEPAAHWRDRARDMVTFHVATLDPPDEPLGVERTGGC